MISFKDYRKKMIDGYIDNPNNFEQYDPNILAHREQFAKDAYAQRMASYDAWMSEKNKPDYYSPENIRKRREQDALNSLYSDRSSWTEDDYTRNANQMNANTRSDMNLMMNGDASVMGRLNNNLLASNALRRESQNAVEEGSALQEERKTNPYTSGLEDFRRASAVTERQLNKRSGADRSEWSLDDYDKQIRAVNNRMNSSLGLTIDDYSELSRYDDYAKQLEQLRSERGSLAQGEREDKFNGWRLADYDARINELNAELSALNADAYDYSDETYNRRRELNAELTDLTERRNVYALNGGSSEKYAGNRLDPDFAMLSQPRRDVNDDTYQYVNGDQSYLASVNPSVDNSYGFADPLEYTKNMTAEERQMYNYIYNTQGSEEAGQYLNDIKQSVEKRAVDDMNGQIENASVGGNIGYNLLSIATAPARGVEAGIGLIESAITGETYDPYSAQAFWGNFANAVQQTTSERIVNDETLQKYHLEGLANFLYGVGTSTAESASSAFTLGMATVPLMGLSAFQSRMKEMTDAGVTFGTALADSAAAGIAESFFEKFSIENLIKISNVDTMKRFITETAKQAFTEGSEELFTDISNTLSDYMIRGGRSDIVNTYTGYLDKGYTIEEARHATAMDMASQYAESFLAGALSGGLSAGGASAVSYAQNASIGRDIRKTGMESYERERAKVAEKVAGENSESAEYRKDLESRRIENLSNAQLGMLASKAENDLANATDVQRASYNLGGEYSVSEETSDKGTGNKLAVEGVTTDDEGNAVLRTSEGTKNLSEVNLSPSDATLVAYARENNLDADIQNSLFEGFSEGMDADEYVNAFDLARAYAQTGTGSDYVLDRFKDNRSISLSTVSDVYKKSTLGKGVINEQKLREAFKGKKLNGNVKANIDDSVINYGSKDVEGKVKWSNLSTEQKNQIIIAKNFANQFGINLTFFESETEGEKRVGGNGYYEPSTNTIGLDVYSGFSLKHGSGAESAIINTMSHEITHWAKEKSPKLYEELKDLVMNGLYKSGYANGYMYGSIQEEMEREKEYRKSIGLDPSTVTEEVATDELIARACEDFLRNSDAMKASVRNLSEDAVKDLHGKVKEIIQKLKAWVKNVLSALPSKSKEAEALRSLEKGYDEIEAKWNQLVTSAIALNNKLGGVNAVIGEQSGSDIIGNNSAVFSIRTYEESGREKLESWLNSQSDIDADTKKSILDEMNEKYDLVKRYANSGEFSDFSMWQNTTVEFNDEGKPVLSVVVPNGEYEMNIDFSTVCKKRKALDKVLIELTKKGMIDVRKLTQKEIGTINRIIKENGLEIACALCFVDSKRYRVSLWANAFTDGTDKKVGFNDMVRSVARNLPNVAVDWYNFSSTNENEGDGNTMLKDLTNEELDALDPTWADQLDDIMASNNSSTAQYKMAYAIKNNQNLRSLLNPNDIIQSEGNLNLKKNNSELQALIDVHQGSARPKPSYSETAYNSEILTEGVTVSGKTITAEEAYKVGGVRVQSFSDYMANMVFDYVQMIADMSAKKLPSHAYTKETAFAELFGLTGMKINMSMVPKAIDHIATAEELQKGNIEKLRKYAGLRLGADGKPLAIAKRGKYGEPLAADGKSIYLIEDETFNYDDALRIRSKDGYSKNVGTIWVGISDAHIRTLLADPTADMVIPYHKSGLNADVAKMRNISMYKDYTRYQNTRYDNAKKTKVPLATVAKSFDWYDALKRLGDAKLAADEYLKVCKEEGWIPKFDQFKDDPNYYKLLEDFRVYDLDGSYAPQAAVSMTFGDDFEDVMRASLEDSQKTSDKLSSRQGKIISEVKEELGLKERMLSRRDSTGSELSESQAEYFRDSKVRDEEGNLLRMYHGTKADFTVFDKNFIGSTGAFEGTGFNFTPSEGRAKSYGGKVMEGYVNVTNPLSADKKTISVAKLAEIIRKVDPTGDDIISNYAQETRDYGKPSFIRRESLTTARAIFRYAENDVDIYSDLSASSGGSVNLMDYFTEAGYDGAIHYNDDGSIKTVIAFNSNQFKNATNENPTSNEDVRYSRRYSDEEYMDAVNSGDTEKARQMVLEKANEYLNGQILPNDEDEVGFKFHRGPAPTKTFKRYAVLNVSEDGFRAAYAGNKNPTPVGVWLDAQNLKSYVSDKIQFDDGTFASYIPGDTGKSWKEAFSEEAMQVFLDDGVKKSRKWLLERGGKHSSDVPNFSQMNLKQDENGNKVSSAKDGALPHNKLIFEIEYGITEGGDLTEYVKENGRKSGGKNQGLAKINPNQYYDFKTNPNAVGKWGIGGTFKINRLVPYEEVVRKTNEYKSAEIESAKKLFESGEISKEDRDKRIKGAKALSIQKWVGGYHPEDFNLSEESVRELYKEGRKAKLLDPVTYDDNGNVIPLSERFNSESDDIRYSRRNDSVYAEVGKLEQYEKRIARLEEVIKLQNQIIKSEKTPNSLSMQNVQAVARKLAKSWNIKEANISDISEKLMDIYQIIGDKNLAESGSSDKKSFDTVINRAMDLSQELIAKSAGKQIKSDEYAQMYKDIKENKISLTEEQTKEAIYEFGENFKSAIYRQYGIRVARASENKEGYKPLTNVFEHLNELYPSVFNADKIGNGSDKNMLKYIAETAKSAKESALIVTEYNIAEAQSEMALNIIDGFNSIKRVKAEQNKIDELSKENKRLAEAERKLKALVEEVDDSWRKKSQKALTAQQNLYTEMLTKQDRKIKRLEYTVKSRQKKEDQRRVINSIAKNTERMMKFLTENSSSKHIPEGLKPVVAEFLKSIDLTSDRGLAGDPTKKDLAFRRSIERMEDLMRSINNGSDANYSNFPMIPQDFVEQAAEIKNRVDELMKENGGYNDHIVYRLSQKDLENLDDLVKAFRKLVEEYDTAFSMARGQKISDLAESTIMELDKMPKYKNTGTDKAKNAVDWGMALPWYAFQRFGTGGKKVFKALQNGQSKLAFNASDVIDFSKKTFTSKEAKEWSNKVHTFKLGNLSMGSEIKLTTSQIMSMYCLSKRQQARLHMLNDEGNNGLGIKIVQADALKEAQAKAFKLSETDLNSILETLTGRQKEVADALQKYMNTVGSDWGNEVSMTLWGIEKFGEENYFPIKSNANELDAASAEKQENPSIYALINRPWTKNTTFKANNSIEIDDIFDVFGNHMSDMARYNAFAVPVMDAIRWLNYRDPSNKSIGTQSMIDHAYGEAGKRYIKNLLQDLNSRRSVGRDFEGIAKKMTSHFKVAAVGANIRVALLQPTAYIRASAVISPVYLAQASNVVARPKALMSKIELAKEKCGIAKWKSLGFYDTDISRGLVDQIKQKESAYDKISEISMKGAEFGDSATWGVLFYACELKVRKENPSLKVGSDEYYQKVSDNLEDIIYRTQVVDGMLTRSQSMRSPALAEQMLTSFMSEPTVSINLLNHSILGYRDAVKSYGKDSEKAKKALNNSVRAVGAYVATAFVSAVVESFMDWYREEPEDEDEDEDKKDEEDKKKKKEPEWYKFARYFLGNFGDDIGIAGKVPIVKDMISIMQGYSASIPYLQAAQSAYYAATSILNIGKKDYVSRNGYQEAGTIQKAVKYSLQTMSYAFGLGIYNAYRDTIKGASKLPFFDEAAWNEWLNSLDNSYTKGRDYKQTRALGAEKNTTNFIKQLMKEGLGVTLFDYTVSE